MKTQKDADPAVEVARARAAAFVAADAVPERYVCLAFGRRHKMIENRRQHRRPLLHAIAVSRELVEATTNVLPIVHGAEKRHMRNAAAEANL